MLSYFRQTKYLPTWIIALSMAAHLALVGAIVLSRVRIRETAAALRHQFNFNSRFPPLGEVPKRITECAPPALLKTAEGSPGVLMLGDSLTEQADWALLLGRNDIVNHGLSGDSTECILYRLPISLRLAPKTIVLMAGTNDLLQGHEPKVVALDYWRLLATTLQSLPRTHLIVVSVPPTKFENQAQPIRQMNQILRNMADQLGVKYVDVHAALANEQGLLRPEYTTDGIHFNSIGYAELVEKLRPAL